MPPGPLRVLGGCALTSEIPRSSRRWSGGCGGDWVEIGECGLAHPEVLRGAGLLVPPHSGLALGLGLDRILMLRKGIPDIRLLRTADPRVASQMLDLEPYRAVSHMPPVSRDLSLMVAEDLSKEELGDLVREALAAQSAAVEVIEVRAETPYAALPPQAVARMGALPGQKNVLLRVVLRDLERTHDPCAGQRAPKYHLSRTPRGKPRGAGDEYGVSARPAHCPNRVHTASRSRFLLFASLRWRTPKPDTLVCQGIMEERAESSSALAAVGLVLASAGCLIVVAGLLYAAAGWRYGGVVAIWGAEWGLPLIGLGVGVARFGRRGTSVIATGCGLAGTLLIAMGELSREYDSYPVAGAIGGLSILVGIASAVTRRKSKKA